MAQHASLGHSSGATRVDQTAALARLLLVSMLLNNGVLDFLAKCHKVLPQVDQAALGASW